MSLSGICVGRDASSELMDASRVGHFGEDKEKELHCVAFLTHSSAACLSHCHPLSMTSRHFVTPTKPILRATLRSTPSNGHDVFIPQIRKMIFEYCETWPTSSNMRTYLLNHLQDVARQNPYVEVVVKHRPHREPIVRGLYCESIFFWMAELHLISFLVTSKHPGQSYRSKRFRG